MLFGTMENRAQGRYSADDPVTLCPITEPRQALAPWDSGSPYEAWLLPRPDSQHLQFESRLGELADNRFLRTRVWIHNRQAPHLTLWESALQNRNMSVCLFETPGLEAAVSHLNDLRAQIWLDVGSILETAGGPEALGRILERFLFDTSWNSPVMPFSTMLLGVVKAESGSLTNRYGLEPGTFRIDESRNGDTPPGFAAELLARLQAEVSSPKTWLEARRPCQDCSHLSVCGGCLAVGDGKPCRPAGLQLVARIQEVGLQIRAQMAPPTGI